MNASQRWSLCLLLPWLAAAAPRTPPVPAIPVPLVSRPGTPLDATARSLAAQDLAEAGRTGEQPLLLIGQARLGTATNRPAVFVQLQSPRECGSAGCSTSVYAWINGRWRRVLDSAAGQVAVAATRHRGMADLVTDAETYIWNGTAYASRTPAPDVDLRPRRTRPGRPG